MHIGDISNCFKTLEVTPIFVKHKLATVQLLTELNTDIFTKLYLLIPRRKLKPDPALVNWSTNLLN